MSTTHPAQPTAIRWRLDPSASSAEFRAPMMWGLASVAGRFEPLDGRLEIDAEGHSHIELTLDAASLDTGNGRRDRHLRSAAFFDAEQHPTLRFRSSDVIDHGGGRLEVAGELAAAGGRAPLQVEVTVTHADGGLDVDAAATVDRPRLGMTWSPLGVIGTSADLRVHAHLRRD
jgi:polyisoprenoid-binding protein YceI